MLDASKDMNYTKQTLITPTVSHRREEPLLVALTARSCVYSVCDTLHSGLLYLLSFFTVP